MVPVRARLSHEELRRTVAFAPSSRPICQVLHFTRRYGTHAATRWQQALLSECDRRSMGRPRCFLSATYGSRVEAAPPHEAKLDHVIESVITHKHTQHTVKGKADELNPHSVKTPTTVITVSHTHTLWKTRTAGSQSTECAAHGRTPARGARYILRTAAALQTNHNQYQSGRSITPPCRVVCATRYTTLP